MFATARRPGLKTLAVASAQPSALVPGLATVAEALPGFQAVQVYGFLAAARTPKPIIRRLSQEIAQVLSASEVKERFFATGVEIVAQHIDRHADWQIG